MSKYALIFSCHRKRRFNSRRLAVTARNQAARNAGQKMSVYQCDTCKGWHICKRRNHKGRRTSTQGKSDEL